MIEINLNGQGHDIVQENIMKLKQLFPDIVSEDKIDFGKLQAVLGNYIEKDNEGYRFTWHGKSDAFRKSQAPSTGTLRPSIRYKNGTEDSKDWDTTKNLYIEGDNLEVLKLLQKSYNNKIKMIYIDPPYNRDKDFVYSDIWSDPIKEYKRITGQLDEDNNVTSSDTEGEGGKHTNWLNMMYPRLRLARNLLTDDGVIFISIDDTELDNVRKICDEIYGEENFIGLFVINSSPSAIDYGHIAKMHDYAIFYAKNIDNTITSQLTEKDKKFKYSDEKGSFNLYPLYNGNVAFNPRTRPNLFYPFFLNPLNLLENDFYEIGLEKKDGWIEVYPVVSRKDEIQRVWRWSKNKALPELNKEIVGYKTESGEYRVVQKTRLTGKVIRSLQTDTDISSRRGTSEVENLFGNKLFSFPKPIELIKRFMSVGTGVNDVVLDFFSGSATTAHAAMQLNAEDGGNRKFILVQLPESIDEENEAFKAGYINICEIGKERIRRSGEKIKAELQAKYEAYHNESQLLLEDEEQPPMNPDDLDIGFKVFKLDNSNFKKWSVDVGEDFYRESKEEQNAILSELLGIEINNFEEDRSELDVVYEIMLKYGLDLTWPIETYNIDGKNIYSIGSGGLIVCLDHNIHADLADKIVDLIKELEPSMVRVAVRDLGFNTDDSKTNFKETLKNSVFAYFDSRDDKASKENQFEFITI